MANIIEPSDIIESLPSATYTVLDISRPDTYQQAHLPEALPVLVSQIVSATDVVKGYMAPLHELKAWAHSLALKPDSYVLVYDDEGGGWAGRLMWTLHYLGISHVDYLNGGIANWLQQGFASTPVPSPLPTPSDIPFNKNPSVSAELEEILESLHDPEVVLVDTRPLDFYLGRRVTALKNGHIPGAIHFPASDCLDPEQHMKLKSLDWLQAQFTEKGITPDKTIICYCNSFHSAALVYMVLKCLGYPSVKGYAGSWSEWGNHPDTPVDKE